jgi:hypothetical protein
MDPSVVTPLPFFPFGSGDRSREHRLASCGIPPSSVSNWPFPVGSGQGVGQEVRLCSWFLDGDEKPKPSREGAPGGLDRAAGFPFPL